MNHGSLFSGIGGFDLASEWMGWNNKFHCEWNEFGQKILNYYWPNAESYGDITKTDFTIWNGRIDILTGGFPCQPYSQAGKRRGKEDERHLWPEMLRAIKEIKPRWIVGENVYGIVNWNGGMVFDEVQTQLEDEGYIVQPYVLPAAGVNAPHQRYRVWFVAYNSMYGCKRGNGKSNGNSERKPDSTGIGERFRNEGIEHGLFGNASNTENERSWSGQGVKRGRVINRIERGKIRCGVKATCCTSNATNSNGSGFKGERKQSISATQKRISNSSNSWRKFPTQSPVCNGDDGISTKLDGITFSKWRTESIKGGGNAIVPQVALQIFKAIEQYEI